MPYIIDGHNLIGKIHSISLSRVDDELALIKLLQSFCLRYRKRVEVYFDNAPPGQPRARTFGSVSAHFVREESSADAAIQARLRRLGKTAKNWVVVSSDRQVAAAARASQARVMLAEEFTQMLFPTDEVARGEEKPSQEEDIDEWLRRFGAKY